MSEKFTGTVVVTSSSDDESIRLDAESCTLTMGGSQPPRITLRDSLDRKTMHLDGATGYVDLKGLTGHVHVGGRGEDGGLFLDNADDQSTVRLDSGASLELGGHGSYGSVYLGNAEGRKTIAMYGKAGDIVLYSGPRQRSIRLSGQSGNVHLGGNGQDGDIFVENEAGETTIHLSGGEGVIHVPNADCAEDFRVAADAVLEAGDVVVFDRSAALRLSEREYDRRVAGVVSGAGDTRPGIVLGRDAKAEGRLPVALVGRVNCKVDAAFGAIDVGDLLTTSPRPGHAMKADDPARAFGAVLGKALSPLDRGEGMIPVLVALR
ncbi:MAG: hypothetical protein GY719_21810 [bacterium]|nr:hypothetical protein [bacterium]